MITFLKICFPTKFDDNRLSDPSYYKKKNEKNNVNLYLFPQQHFSKLYLGISSYFAPKMSFLLWHIINGSPYIILKIINKFWNTFFSDEACKVHKFFLLKTLAHVNLFKFACANVKLFEFLNKFKFNFNLKITYSSKRLQNNIYFTPSQNYT